MFIDVNNIKYNAYTSLVRDMLKINDTIMFSCIDPFEFDFEDTNTDLYILDWQDLNIANYENVVSFKINYSKVLNFFDKFDSYGEIFDTTGIYRIMFANNGVIKCVCMSDEIVVY